MCLFAQIGSGPGRVSGQGPAAPVGPRRVAVVVHLGPQAEVLPPQVLHARSGLARRIRRAQNEALGAPNSGGPFGFLVNQNGCTSEQSRMALGTLATMERSTISRPHRFSIQFYLASLQDKQGRPCALGFACTCGLARGCPFRLGV